MAIIMRSGSPKKDQDNKKKIYTWVGCGLVTVLTLVSVIPNMGREPKALDYSKFSSSKQHDLAAMPFGTDAEASSFLGDNQEYADVASNAKLLESLFSSEDRKERHEKDMAEGVPPPPDPQYKEIAKQKEQEERNKKIIEDRKEKKKRDRNETSIASQRIRNTPTTKPASFNPGKGISNSGNAGTATVGSNWRYEGKDIRTGQGNTMPANHNLTAKDVTFAQKFGRRSGLDAAVIKSLQGAKADDAEKAANNAIEAFQKQVTPEDLDKAKEELDFGEDLPTIDPNLQDDLKRAINDDVKDKINSNSSNTAKGKEYSINENCMDTNGKFIWWPCWGTKMLTNLGNSVVECALSGCWTNWGTLGSAVKK